MKIIIYAHYLLAIMLLTLFCPRSPTSTLLHYSETTVQLAISGGRPVVIVAASSWCSVCKKMEPIWNSPKIRRFVKEHNILVFKADLSGKDREGTAFLQKEKQTTIPYGVMYYKGTKVVLPTTYNEESLLEFLQTYL